MSTRISGYSVLLANIQAGKYRQTRDCTYEAGILVNSKFDILITSTDFVLEFYPVYLEVLGTEYRVVCGTSTVPMCVDEHLSQKAQSH